MTKAKQRQMGALATKKGKVSGGIDEDLEIEDDWVIVKKQKITIIVPPSPLPVHKKRSVLKTRHVSTKRRKTLHPQKHKRNSTTVLNHKENRNSPTLTTLPKVVHHFSGESMDQRPSVNFVCDHHRLLKPLGVSGVPKAVRVPAAPHRRPAVFRRPICLNVTALQNRMMRASNLERKLVKAGGLNRWLVSLDLGQFVKMFHRRNVDKFQLLSLTMEKLKDMGVNAVGPRRKLIHAIDCVNHPCCFSTS